MSEQAYLDLLAELVKESEQGDLVNDRTGVGNYNLFHRTLRFNLQEGFPLITTKRMGLKSIVGELLWFLEGNTNAKYLEEKYGSTIWREWADEDGELKEVYGYQWRSFGSKSEEDGDWIFGITGFDQVSWLLNEIKTNPTSRRLYVTAANPLSVLIVTFTFFISI